MTVNFCYNIQIWKVRESDRPKMKMRERKALSLWLSQEIY